MTESSPELQGILDQQVYIGGANRRFGDVVVGDVRARADELRAATGFGPTARVAPVAMAWRELVMAMERAGVGIVSELDGPTLVELAPKLWVVMPGFS